MQKFKEIVEANERFVLTTHINPDGDGIGSEIGLYFYLKQLGKSVHILNASKMPKIYDFLENGFEIHHYSPDEHEQILKNTQILIALDIGDYSRMGSLVDLVSTMNLFTVSIDHHPKMRERFDFYLTDTAVSSTAEIIFSLFENDSQAEITREIAEALYVGIMTDTGRFSYDSTSSETHKIAAALLSCGIEPYSIFNKVYEQNSRSRIPLLKDFLSNAQFVQNQRVAYSFLTRKMLQNAGAIREDMNGFIDLLRTVEGVEITVMFTEIDRNATRVNFRSRGKYPVNILAGKFNGGGHPNAAGATIEEPMKLAIPTLLLEIEKMLKNNKENK